MMHKILSKPKDLRTRLSEVYLKYKMKYLLDISLKKIIKSSSCAMSFVITNSIVKWTGFLLH